MSQGPGKIKLTYPRICSDAIHLHGMWNVARQIGQPCREGNSSASVLRTFPICRSSGRNTSDLKPRALPPHSMTARFIFFSFRLCHSIRSKQSLSHSSACSIPHQNSGSPFSQIGSRKATTGNRLLLRLHWDGGLVFRDQSSNSQGFYIIAVEERPNRGTKVLSPYLTQISVIWI